MSDYGMWNTTCTSKPVIKQDKPCVKCGYNGVTYEYIRNEKKGILRVTCYGCGYAWWAKTQDSDE